MNDYEKKPQTQAPKPMTIGRKVSLGVLIVAVPLGAAWMYDRIKRADGEHNYAEEKGAAYDTRALREIDPAMVRYQQSAQIETGLKSVTAIMVDKSGRLLAAGDRSVRVLDEDGNVLLEITLDAEPTCLAEGPDGALLVGFRDHVEIFGADGKPQKVWASLGRGSHVTGLAVLGGEVYVGDSGRQTVLRCDLDGVVINDLGTRDDSRGVSGLLLASPYLHVATVGAEVLVSNPGRHRIETYRPDGQLERFWGKAGAGIEQFLGCCNPSNFAVLSDGRIVTAEKGVPRVKVYQPDGRLDAVVVGPEAFGQSPHGLGLAVDAKDRVMVVEPGKSVVRVFAMKEGGAS